MSAADLIALTYGGVAFLEMFSVGLSYDALYLALEGSAYHIA